MKSIDCNLTRLRTGDSARLLFEVPTEIQPHMWSLCREVEALGDARYRVRISSKWKARTTGANSQNHFINGACQSIAEQTGNSFSAVKDEMKRRAISRGYPFKTLPDGTPLPASETELSTIEAGYLIDTIIQFAAEWNIKLMEVER
jgi:hypothetical protein